MREINALFVLVAAVAVGSCIGCRQRDPDNNRAAAVAPGQADPPQVDYDNTPALRQEGGSCSEIFGVKIEILTRATNSTFHVRSKVIVLKTSNPAQECFLQESFQKGGYPHRATWTASLKPTASIVATSFESCQVDDTWHSAEMIPCLLNGADEGERLKYTFRIHTVTAEGPEICKTALQPEITSYSKSVEYLYRVEPSYGISPIGDPSLPAFACLVTVRFQEFNGNHAPWLSADWLMFPNRSDNRRIAVSKLGSIDI